MVRIYVWFLPRNVETRRRYIRDRHSHSLTSAISLHGIELLGSRLERVVCSLQGSSVCWWTHLRDPPSDLPWATFLQNELPPRFAELASYTIVPNWINRNEYSLRICSYRQDLSARCLSWINVRMFKGRSLWVWQNSSSTFLPLSCKPVRQVQSKSTGYSTVPTSIFEGRISMFKLKISLFSRRFED